MHRILEIKPLADYRLWLRYDDGTEGAVDLSHLAGRGVFSSWKDPDQFADVSLSESGAPTWGDRADLCPDALYLRLTDRSPTEEYPSLRKTIPDAGD